MAGRVVDPLARIRVGERLDRGSDRRQVLPRVEVRCALIAYAGKTS
jgi:hypothetical protein